MKQKFPFYFLIFLSALFLSSCETDNIASKTESTGNVTYKPGSSEVKAHKEKAYEYFEKGLYREAKMEFEWILANSPKEVEPHYKLGVIYSKLGLMAKSCAEFLETITLDSKYAKAYYNLAVLYSTENSLFSFETASHYFRKYLALEPSSEHRENIEQWLAKKGKGNVQGDEEIPEELVVKKENLNVYGTPTLDSEVVAKLTKGGKGKVLDYFQSPTTQAFFYKIKLTTGQSGWVYEPENR